MKETREQTIQRLFKSYMAVNLDQYAGASKEIYKMEESKELALQEEMDFYDVYDEVMDLYYTTIGA